MAVDDSGNGYVVGRVSGALPGQTALGQDDAYLRKYDSSGNEAWTYQFGSEDNDRALAVAIDETRNLYVVGGTYGNLLSQTKLVRSHDAFVIKMSVAE